MIALAEHLEEHRQALESDALTLLQIRLEDVPDTIGWDGFYCVIANADERSALNRALFPEYASYSGPLMASKILTDIYDAISAFIYVYGSAHSSKGRKPKKPERYPAPWTKEEADETTVYGKGAIPKNEFLDWYYDKTLEEEGDENEDADI